MSRELTILHFNSWITLLIPLIMASLVSTALCDRYLLSWTACIASVCSDPTSTSLFLFTDTSIITCLALSPLLTSQKSWYSMFNYSSCCRSRHSPVTLQATQCPQSIFHWTFYLEGKPAFSSYHATICNLKIHLKLSCFFGECSGQRIWIFWK